MAEVMSARRKTLCKVGERREFAVYGCGYLHGVDIVRGSRSDKDD